MKRYIILTAIASLSFASCNKFLEEKPRSKLVAPLFYATPNQIKTAVDGAYQGLETPYVSVFLGLPLSEYWAMESLTGFSDNVFGTGPDETTYDRLDDIDPRNGYLLSTYRGIYAPLKSINLAISKINATTVLDDATKSSYLGQLHFLRAWHYFHGVRVFGEMPLITEPIEGISNDQTQFPKAKIDRIYDQIVSDLTTAETKALPWRDETGHVSMSAVKSLLAHVYITMAGFPLQKGNDYYNMAYEKSKEVINPGAGGTAINLATNYADLRNPANNNRGEHIFQVQRSSTLSGAHNELPLGMVPLLNVPEPEQLSRNLVFEAALLPTNEFYETYPDNDKRKQDRQFFLSFTDDDGVEKVMNYKFWDDAFHSTPSTRSGLNIWLIRYADVLLINAEAKARADGGSTSDATAVKAYNDVHRRAIPTDPVAGTITAEQVLKERFHELAFEYVSWFDMLRTRQTLNMETGNIVPLLGYKSPSHLREFKESDLIQPLPTQARLLNPKLNEPAQ
ncbi:RagB/SusD family nutrient uptake outer membrane protein [Mucilaginibacter hurinus]|uniref:RagB/SusD family nutrient uptake outer membrane protein n=1 Tax=Mucilaginibacter hurinus TaxID=2201324 RepID=A0A367GTS8_9SPHI|nr:RagB/SusD family nutrient uptake outer membrane protein [Mucilaginibacter hurinus]RCH56113.1 RagB/SusD family nutrient uptake outer membrane protein [Mucilaginibacter hurinus]